LGGEKKNVSHLFFSCALFSSFFHHVFSPSYLVFFNAPTITTTHSKKKYTETIAKVVQFNLEPTIAIFAICSCQIANRPIIVLNADSVGWEDGSIFDTVAIVECALTRYCLTITIARRESTIQIVPCVKKICLAVDKPRTKCPVDTPFIGTVSKN
jgi:hypothetical protein